MEKIRTPSVEKSQYFLLNLKFLAGFFALFVLLTLTLSRFTTSSVSMASDLSLENILRAVNEQRSLRNLVTLNTNSKLTAAGQSKSDDMQARHYFAHVDPDGKYIWDKIVAAGYTPYLQLGENLAIEFYDTESLVAAWMNSPTHRANILQEGFKDQGLGLTFGNSNEGQYHSAIVNAFGTLVKPSSGTTLPPPPPTPTPPPSQPVPAPTPVPLPQPTPAPILQPQPVPKPVEPNPTPTTPVAAPVPSPSPTPATSQSPTAVVGSSPEISLNIGKANRYLILIFGAALLLFLLSDLKRVVEEKTHSHYDKKTNNIMLLVIAIIVIAYIYWL